MDGLDVGVLQKIVEIAVDSRDRQLFRGLARSLGRGAENTDVRTPIRRSASTCTGPMKPPPIKAAPGASWITVALFMVSGPTGPPGQA